MRIIDARRLKCGPNTKHAAESRMTEPCRTAINIKPTKETTSMFNSRAYVSMLPNLSLCHEVQRKRVIQWCFVLMFEATCQLTNNKIFLYLPYNVIVYQGWLQWLIHVLSVTEAKMQKPTTHWVCSLTSFRVGCLPDKLCQDIGLTAHFAVCYRSVVHG